MRDLLIKEAHFSVEIEWRRQLLGSTDGLSQPTGTITMWHKEAFSYGDHVVGTGFIAIVGYHLKAKCQCVVVNVYAACNLKDKVVQWEALTTL